MSAADHHDVETGLGRLFHVKHVFKHLLPDAKPRKDLSENVLDADPTDHPVEGRRGATQILGDQLRLGRFRRQRRR